MTQDFYKEYYICRSKGRLKEALFFNNPTKYQAVHYLKKMHEERGDKIIIFCDHIFSLKEYAHRLGIPYISGEVSNLERMNIIS
jgi:DNA excision repair protein ERCC-3